jgi:hypothetical protein
MSAESQVVEPASSKPEPVWRGRHRENADKAAKVAAAQLAQSGRILRPRVSRKRRVA